MSDVPAAIDQLETDMRAYENSTGVAFPAEQKVPLLFQLIPEVYKDQLEAKYTMGKRDFRRMCDNISQ